MTITAGDESQLPQSGQPLSEVLEGFLRAQRLDLYPPEELAPGIVALRADDDESLVNSYVTYQAGPDSPPADLERLVRSARLDPSRTDIVIADALADQVRDIRKSVGGGAHRVLPLSECLDGFLRPARICDELTGDRGTDAEVPLSRRRDGPSMFDAALLNDDVWIDQAAEVPGLGRVSAQHYLNQSWSQGKSPRLCVVIAPAGHGKSKVTHILARRLAQRYQSAKYGHRPPLPILIPFGNYPRGTSNFDGLILRFMDAFGVAKLRVEAFRYLISLGRVLFILDGYDEMVEANPGVAAENVAGFVREAGPYGRILLTSRSTFYRTAADIVGQIGDPLLSEVEVEVIDLLPFNQVQAKEYVAQRLRDRPDRTQAMQRGQRIIDEDWNPEILGSPIFLAEFVNLIAEDRWSMADVRQRGLQEYLIETSFERERVRQDHAFSNSQQRAYLQNIAFDLLTTNAVGYQRSDLEIFALEVAENEALQDNWPTLWRGLASHYFLLPDTDAGESPVATMRHQVWRDYFQGSALATHLNDQGERAFSALATRDLPEGVLRSADDFLAPHTRAWLLGKLAQGPDKLLRNMLRMTMLRKRGETDVLLRLPAEIGSRLAGRNLSDMVFREVLFEGSLADSNLTGCFFDRCDLSQASLAGAVLERTVFSGCALPATELTDATVDSVTINGEDFFGPELAAKRARTEPESTTGSSKAAEATSEVRNWVTDVLWARLAKFTPARGGEAYAGLDTSISWIAFMGGTNPRDRDFVVRRLYRALRAENVVYDAPTGMARRPTVFLSNDPEIRADVVAFVRAREIGPAIEAVIGRLVK
jgi:uncharacterized protein YjbI with pentapeptide repeats